MAQIAVHLIMLAGVAPLFAKGSGVPKPTARQLQWTDMEIAALVHVTHTDFDY